MKTLNLKRINKPIKISQIKYFDKRGYFQEIFLKKNFKLDIKFTAIARSKKNVIRGLHFQLKNKQTKLIHVVQGKILDVVVNLKKNSRNLWRSYTVGTGKQKMILNNIDMINNYYRVLINK